MLGLLLLCVLGYVHAQTDPHLIFPVIGDWGTGTTAQDEVANGLARWADEAKPDFIVSAGDNFYDGVFSPDDPWFDERWKDVYNPYMSLERLMWYITVGNHDYYDYGDDKEWFQVERHDYDDQWYFPHLWYKLDTITTHAGTADFFMLDTQAMRKDMNDWRDQVDWLEDGLATSTADWKIVVGHHPMYTAGNHYTGSSTVRNYVEPLMEQYGAQIYVCGHDHNLQHGIHSNSDTSVTSNIDHILTGGGGRSLYGIKDDDAIAGLEDMGTETMLFYEGHGFVSFEFENDGLEIRYHSKNGTEFYSILRTPDMYLS